MKRVVVKKRGGMKNFLGFCAVILTFFMCFGIQSASAMRRLGQELPSGVAIGAEKYLKSARTRACLTTGQGCVRLEKRLLLIARNLGLLGAGYAIGRIARPQQPTVSSQLEPEVASLEELKAEPPVEVAPSAISSIKEFLKSPEVMACKKFGACSDMAKWLIRAIESAIVVAGVAGGVWLGKNSLKKLPTTQDS